ncbi:MAG: Fic family protein [Planctomycetota bacterium]
MPSENQSSPSPPWRQILAHWTPDAGAPSQLLAAVDAKSWWPDEEYRHWEDGASQVPHPDLSPDRTWALAQVRRRLAATSIPQACDPKALAHHACLGLPSILATQHELDRFELGDGKSADWQALLEPLARSSREHEALGTSLLAGCTVDADAAREMLRQGRAPRSEAEQTVRSSFDALHWVSQQAHRAIDCAGLLELQSRILSAGADPDHRGRFRRASERMPVRDESGRVIYEPPPAAALKKRLERLCDYAENDDPQSFLHPLVKATLLHYSLAGERPFVDGNGRSARALFHWFLLRQGYAIFSQLALSPIILSRQEQYRRAFLHSQHDGDLTYFILFQFAAVKTALNRLRGARRQGLASLKAMLRGVPGASGLNHRQQALLAHAMNRPDTSYTVPAHGQTHGVVLQTARVDLQGLEAKGFLSKNRAQRAHHWILSNEFVRIMASAQESSS